MTLPATLPLTIGATEARVRFAELLGRVAFAGERILVTRNNQPVGVLIPMADYERLVRQEQAPSDGAAKRSSGGDAAPR